jgi:hypothetical protein
VKFHEALGLASEQGVWIAPDKAEWAASGVEVRRDAYKWTGNRWLMASESPGGGWVMTGMTSSFYVGVSVLSWQWEVVEVKL